MSQVVWVSGGSQTKAENTDTVYCEYPAVSKNYNYEVFNQHKFRIEMEGKTTLPLVQITCEIKNVTKNLVIFSETRGHGTPNPYFWAETPPIYDNYEGDTIRHTATCNYVIQQLWVMLVCKTRFTF